MKKFLLLVLLTFAFAVNNAKGDVIILKTGESKMVYNIEVSNNYIFFNESPDDSSDISKIAVTDIFGYKVGDGEILTMDSAKPTSSATSNPAANSSQGNGTPTLMKNKIAEDNDKILARLTDFTITPKKKSNGIRGGAVTPVWSFSKKSILSDDNLWIGVDMFHYLLDGVGYKIKLTNKTDKMIYVDLANSFETIQDGIAKPFYTNKIYTTNDSRSSGGSLNLGAVAGAVGIGGAVGTLASGISVGGGNTKGTTVTESQSAILAIPPHSSKYIPCEKVKIGGDYDYQEMPICLYFINSGRHIDNKLAFAYQHQYLKRLIFWDGVLPVDNEKVTGESIGLTKNGYVEFEEEAAPKRRDFTITYSDSPQFSTYYQLPLGFYLRGFFGGVKSDLNKNCDIAGNGFPMFGVGHIKKK